MKGSRRFCPFISLLGAMAIGAGIMYLLDSGRGVARRARLRAKALRGLRTLSTIAGGKEIRKRSSAVDGRLAIVARKTVPDWVLAERARLEIWRTVAHPDSIRLSVRDGSLTLWGPVRAGEPEKLRKLLAKLPGLRQLELQLTLAEEPAARAS
jgi:hypothetical protein